LSPLQPATHWLPHSEQMKYGKVWVYWVTLGERPSPHTQEKVRVSSSHEFSLTVADSEGGWRQIKGHCVIWLLHQYVLRLDETLFGSIWYPELWADAIDSRALEAMAVAAKDFMVWIFLCFN